MKLPLVNQILPSLLITFTLSLAQAGNSDRGGGEDDGIRFKEQMRLAMEQVESNPKALEIIGGQAKADLIKSKIETVHVECTNDSIIVDEQLKAASNSVEENKIEANCSTLEYRDDKYVQALALHEIFPFANIEDKKYEKSSKLAPLLGLVKLQKSLYYYYSYTTTSGSQEKWEIKYNVKAGTCIKDESDRNQFGTRVSYNTWSTPLPVSACSLIKNNIGKSCSVKSISLSESLQNMGRTSFKKNTGLTLQRTKDCSCIIENSVTQESRSSEVQKYLQPSYVCDNWFGSEEE